MKNVLGGGGGVGQSPISLPGEETHYREGGKRSNKTKIFFPVETVQEKYCSSKRKKRVPLCKKEGVVGDNPQGRGHGENPEKSDQLVPGLKPSLIP